MASSKEFLAYVLEQLSELPDVSWRAMMGEYVLYVGGKVFGGIYDDRLLLKPTAAALALVPDAEYELPYEGAKPMLRATMIDDASALCEIVAAMHADLPAPRTPRKR